MESNDTLTCITFQVTVLVLHLVVILGVIHYISFHAKSYVLLLIVLRSFTNNI